MFLTEEDKSAASQMNRAAKILIFFILILIFTPNHQIPNLNGFAYGEFERTIVCILIPLTILYNSLSPQTLKMGYWFYIQRIFQSFWLASLTIYFFKGIYLFNPIYFDFVDFNILLLIGYGLYLISTLIPGSSKQISLSTTDLFNQYQALKSQTERFRDALLAGGFCLLIFLLLQWVNSLYIELIQFVAFLSLLIGFILIFTPKKHDKSRFGSLMSAVSDQARVIDPTSQLGNRVQNFVQTIQATEFKKPERVYTIPTDQIKLVSKGKTTVTANKGAIVVPTVTENGTALVLMGKSEMETKANQETSTKKEIEGTTTMWLPPEEWDKIKLQLNPIEMSELTETELKTAGIDVVTEIFEKSKKALNDLKKWRGPQGLFSSVLDTTPSKYSITETADYSLVRLPGVYVFESKVLELVNVLGGLVKVIEIKGVGQYVKIFGGFVTVLETPDYSYVQTPFVSVIDTPKGEKIRVFGIDIQEGKKFDLEEIRTKIIQDQRNFDQLFTKRVETLFSEDPQLLMTDSKGEKMGFIVGKDEVLSDTPRKASRKSAKSTKSLKGVKGIKGIKGVEKHKSKHQRKHKHFPVEEKVSLHLGSSPRSSSSRVTTLDLDTNGISKDNPQLQEIDEGLTRVNDAINATDEKFLNNEISENKHTEIINRLKARKEKLQRKKDEIKDLLKPKFV
jgi:hypothetical protein